MTNIRKMEFNDIESWIDINISSWCDNLKGVVSDNLLSTISKNRDARIAKEKENFIDDDSHYVLEVGGKVIGIMKIKKSERLNFENSGEIQLLYLLTEEKSKGYGRELFSKGLELLKKRGFKKAVIGCLDKNPSNEFYKHMGGKYVRQDPWDIFDEHYMENVYFYDLN